MWQTPSCAILPSNEQGVSIAVKIVNFLQIKFATRSGGHSPNPGFAAIGQPGVLIDLQKLKQVTVSADRSTVTLGPGAIWGDVYAQLDPYNIGVIGGRLPSIGVAGLILGGGYFHFSAKYGLAADNVKTFGVNPHKTFSVFGMAALTANAGNIGGWNLYQCERDSEFRPVLGPERRWTELW